MSNCSPTDTNTVIKNVPMDSFFTTTTPGNANPVCKFLTPKQTFPCTDPCLVEDWECFRSVHDYVVKSKQYLEASGVIMIQEPNGLVLQKVMVSGPTVCKDVTASFKQALQLQFPNIDYSCPILGFEFDTGNINLFAGGDIECGYRKIIEFTFLTDDAIYQQRKLRHVGLNDSTYERSYDPTSCDAEGNPILPANVPNWDVVNMSATYKINKDRCCETDKMTNPGNNPM